MRQLGLIALKLLLLKLEMVSFGGPLDVAVSSLLETASLLGEHGQGYQESGLEYLVHIFGAQSVDHFPFHVDQARV